MRTTIILERNPFNYPLCLLRFVRFRLQMDLSHVLDRDVTVLSGGELQRFAIGVVAVQKVMLRMSWTHSFLYFVAVTATSSASRAF